MIQMNRQQMIMGRVQFYNFSTEDTDRLKTIYVGGLSKSTSEDAIKEALGSYGKIESINYFYPANEPETMRAFVKFEEES